MLPQQAWRMQKIHWVKCIVICCLEMCELLQTTKLLQLLTAFYWTSSNLQSTYEYKREVWQILFWKETIAFMNNFKVRCTPKMKLLYTSVTCNAGKVHPSLPNLRERQKGKRQSKHSLVGSVGHKAWVNIITKTGRPVPEHVHAALTDRTFSQSWIQISSKIRTYVLLQNYHRIKVWITYSREQILKKQQRYKHFLVPDLQSFSLRLVSKNFQANITWLTP